MCRTRHLTQVAATATAAATALCNATSHGHSRSRSSGDSAAYAINTLTCYLVVNTNRAWTLFEMDRSQPVASAQIPLTLPLSLSLTLPLSLSLALPLFLLLLSACFLTLYAKLTKSKVAARFDELKVNLPHSPSLPATLPHTPLPLIEACGCLRQRNMLRHEG